MAELIVAREVEIVLFFLAVIKRQRIWIQRTLDNIRFFSVRGQIRSLLLASCRLGPRQNLLKTGIPTQRIPFPTMTEILEAHAILGAVGGARRSQEPLD